MKPKKSMLALVAASLIAGFAIATPASAQNTLEGNVISTQLTQCDFKPGGCAGSLTMEPRDGSGAVTVKVVLGTPITRGTETIYLPALRGNTIVVDYVTQQNEKVAKSIQVVIAKK